MKLSVVIPVYCLEKYVLECISSVMEQQTNFAFEVLVDDDASTDNTPILIREYFENFTQEPDKQLKLFLRHENAGLASNLKSLFAKCTGQYIAYLDGDDLALPGKFQAQVDYLDANPECAIVYHESEMFDSDTNRRIGFYSKDFYNASYIPAKAHISHLVKYGTFLQASSAMFRKHDHMEKVIDPRCQIVVDYPMHMFNAQFAGGSIDRIDQVLGRYRVHAHSFGAQTNRSALRREKVLNELLVSCDNASELGVSTDEIAQGKAHFLYAAALYFLKKGDLSRFVKFIEQSAQRGWFFDQKHKTAFEHRHSPETFLSHYPF